MSRKVKSRRKINRRLNKTKKYNMKIINGGLLGIVRNTSNVIKNLSGRNEDKNQNTPLNISKGIGDLGKGIGQLGKSAFTSIGNIGKPVISEEHKELIKAKLKEIKNEKGLSDSEYNYAIAQLDDRNVKSTSFVSMMGPVQSMVKVVGDFFLSDDINISPRKTHVKILYVPDMYKNYVKNSIPDKNQKYEIGDYMIIVKDMIESPFERINVDFNSVDNLLANTLNQCIGVGCKNNFNEPILLEKSIDVTNNISKKDTLEKNKKNMMRK